MDSFVRVLLGLIVLGFSIYLNVASKSELRKTSPNKVKIYKNMSYSYVEEDVGESLKKKSPILTAAATSFVQPLNYCSFFNNRAPSPQANLKNCTWYKENSCCLQAEIESTFSKVGFYIELIVVKFSF